MSYDFSIDCPDGSTLHGCLCEGATAALYDADGKLVHVGPADLERLRDFGKVRAGMLTRARLELERGFSI